MKKSFDEIEREVRSFYEATPYDTCHGDQGTLILVSEVEKQFLARRGLGKGLVVLDIGCGAGLISSFFSKRGYDCYGLDLSRTAVSIARERYGLQVLQGSNLNLPFKANVADVVISRGVLHHTADPYTSFQELVRVLKSGGIMVVQIYSRGCVYCVLYSTLGRLFRSLERSAWGHAALRKIAVPLFFAASHIWALLQGRRIPEQYHGQVWNHFRDFFLSPQVRACTLTEIQDWFRTSDLTILSYQRMPAIHSVILQKPNG